MFDPTAYENIKVVIEGAIYDRDLEGEILVIDRNDWINTAKMSRKYDITFALAGNKPAPVSAAISLEAGIENLAAELLKAGAPQQLAGCNVSITFYASHRNEPAIYREIQGELESIWGKEREIRQSLQLSPLTDSGHVSNTVTISFNRLVYEDQIDDLADMIGYMVISLEKLQKILSF